MQSLGTSARSNSLSMSRENPSQLRPNRNRPLKSLLEGSRAGPTKAPLDNASRIQDRKGGKVLTLRLLLHRRLARDIQHRGGELGGAQSRARALRLRICCGRLQILVLILRICLCRRRRGRRRGRGRGRRLCLRLQTWQGRSLRVRLRIWLLRFGGLFCRLDRLCWVRWVRWVRWVCSCRGRLRVGIGKLRILGRGELDGRRLRRLRRRGDCCHRSFDSAVCSVRGEVCQGVREGVDGCIVVF